MRSSCNRRQFGGWWIAFLAVVLLVGVSGCTPAKQYGDRKEDWVKSSPPPQWRGPGQPGGPPANALSGAAPTPPPNVAGTAGK